MDRNGFWRTASQSSCRSDQEQAHDAKCTLGGSHTRKCAKWRAATPTRRKAFANRQVEVEDSNPLPLVREQAPVAVDPPWNPRVSDEGQKLGESEKIQVTISALEHFL